MASFIIFLILFPAPGCSPREEVAGLPVTSGGSIVAAVKLVFEDLDSEGDQSWSQDIVRPRKAVLILYFSGRRFHEALSASHTPAAAQWTNRYDVGLPIVSMSQYTIDRIEAGWAVLEDEQGRTFAVPASWLPRKSREGAILQLVLEQEAGTSILRFVPDPDAEQQRRKEIQKLRDELRRRPEGDG